MKSYGYCPTTGKEFQLYNWLLELECNSDNALKSHLKTLYLYFTLARNWLNTMDSYLLPSIK